MKRNWRATLPMGLFAMFGGALLGGLLAHGAAGAGWEYLPLLAGAAGLLTGSALWWLIVSRKGRYTKWRGLLAGALTGLLGHYVIWYLWILVDNVSYWIGGQPGSSLGEPPVDPLTGLFGVAGLAIWGVMLLGWITVPLGALAGLLIAIRQRDR